MRDNFHEGLTREDDLQLGSNRSFGKVMAGAFLVFTGISVWLGSGRWPIWLTAAMIFIIVAWLRPSLLAPLNRLWFRFGLLLNRIVSPLIMGLLFFMVITPIGLLTRIFRQRPLALDFEPDKASYWLTRQDETSPPGAMKKQY